MPRGKHSFVDFEVRMHKGMQPFPANQELLETRLPGYVLDLTSAYAADYPYFEVFECIRKVCIVGVLIVAGRGSITQMCVGLIISFVSTCLYHNLKPYDSWQNDLVQQLCQFTLFVTLLAALVGFAQQNVPTAHETDTTLPLGKSLVWGMRVWRVAGRVCGGELWS